MDKNLDQAKGRLKQAAGDLTDDEDLKRQGKIDEKAGKAKAGLDELKDRMSDAVDTVKDKLKK